MAGYFFGMAGLCVAFGVVGLVGHMVAGNQVAVALVVPTMVVVLAYYMGMDSQVALAVIVMVQTVNEVLAPKVPVIQVLMVAFAGAQLIVVIVVQASFDAQYALLNEPTIAVVIAFEVVRYQQQACYFHEQKHCQYCSGHHIQLVLGYCVDLP